MNSPMSLHHQNHHHSHPAHEKVPRKDQEKAILLARMIMQQELFFEDSTNNNEEGIDGEETLSAPSSPPSALITSEDIFYAMMNGEAIHSIVDNHRQCSKQKSKQHTSVTKNVPIIDASSEDSKSLQVVDNGFNEVIVDEKKFNYNYNYNNRLHPPKRSEKGSKEEHAPSDPTTDNDDDEYGEDDDLAGAIADACWASHSNADRFDATEYDNEDDDEEEEDEGDEAPNPKRVKTI